MMWVRFPNGQVVQYNDANYLIYNNNFWQLYTKKDGIWICSIQVSSGATVEAIKACSAHNPLTQFNPDSLIQLQKEVRSLKRLISKKKL